MGEDQAQQTPMSDHIESALDMMRQGARMILSDIPNDRSMESRCFSGDVSKALYEVTRPEAAQVRVMPLEWTEVEAFGQRYWESQKTPVGTYEAGWNDGAFAQLDGPSMWEWATDGDHRLLSTSDAKAAAQADYEKRILSALEQPNTVAQPDALKALQQLKDNATGQWVPSSVVHAIVDAALRPAPEKEG